MLRQAPDMVRSIIATVRQLGKVGEARQTGTSKGLRDCQCGAADIANHKSGSTDPVTGITALRAVSEFWERYPVARLLKREAPRTGRYNRLEVPLHYLFCILSMIHAQ
jgi:hypothetical protein